MKLKSLGSQNLIVLSLELDKRREVLGSCLHFGVDYDILTHLILYFTVQIVLFWITCYSLYIQAEFYYSEKGE